jgi:glutaredoxin
MKRHTLAFLLAGTTALVFAAGAQAQTVYRIVGANGKVTFSDKPPASADQGKIASTGIGAKTDSTGTALPFELRQVASKYPVVLYTGAKCVPCDTGRAFLMSRGIPFSERTVNTQEDRDYLQRLTSDNSLPYLTIGSQRIKGMSDVEWTQYLDAAGYPQKSALPAAYRHAAPMPLVAVQKAPAAKAEEKEPAPAAEPAVNRPPPTSPSNPAGITF